MPNLAHFCNQNKLQIKCPNRRKWHSGVLVFKISRGRIPPDPSIELAPSALVCSALPTFNLFLRLCSQVLTLPSFLLPIHPSIWYMLIVPYLCIFTKFNPRSDPKSSCVIEVPDMEMLPRSRNGDIDVKSKSLSVQSCFLSLQEVVEVVPKSCSVLW